jgi:hypothetical protein
MATLYTLPKDSLFSEAAASREFRMGLEEACTVSCPDELHDALEDHDLRWDQIVTRAIEQVEESIAVLLDTAIRAEYERTPIAVEQALRAVPA